MPESADQIAITLPRAMWLRMARVLCAAGDLQGVGLLTRLMRPGCQNGHDPQERFVRPNGALRCHACQRAAGKRQRAKGPR